MGQKEHFQPKTAKKLKTRIFAQNPKISLLYGYYATTLCKKTEQTYERILRSSLEGRTNELELEGPQCRLRRGTKKFEKYEDEKNEDQNL